MIKRHAAGLTEWCLGPGMELSTASYVPDGDVIRLQAYLLSWDGFGVQLKKGEGQTAGKVGNVRQAANTVERHYATQAQYFHS